MSVGTGRQNIIIMFGNYQFHFWEYIKGNETFVLDFHRPFICSVLLGLVVDPVLLSALEELVGSRQGAPAGPSQAWFHHCK
jgi:hypothetical protein